MSKYKETFGIDISHLVFDVVNTKNEYIQFKNDKDGFVSFLKIIPKNALVVMEATGYYHFRLAQFLFHHKVNIAVVNPLSVKRFMQMKLAKIKTDKSDAKAICEYAQTNDVPLYNALDNTQAECLQLFRLMDHLIKRQTATKNKIHGEIALGVPSKFVLKVLKSDLKHLQKQIKAIEEKLLNLVKEEQQQQLTLLKSIPGIGAKTALFLIVLTNGFSKFENAKQTVLLWGSNQ